MKVDDLDTVAGNSFRNFHAKGLDYLCIFRSEELTIKAYFYDIADDSSPEIICPHDHRYPFATEISTPTVTIRPRFSPERARCNSQD